MFGGKLARVGAVLLAGMGATFVSAVVGSVPAVAAPMGTIWVNAPLGIPVDGTAAVTVNVNPYGNGPFSVDITLSGGLVVADPSDASFSGTNDPGAFFCGDGTISATPGSQSLTGSATADTYVEAQGFTSCQFSLT